MSHGHPTPSLYGIASFHVDLDGSRRVRLDDHIEIIGIGKACKGKRLSGFLNREEMQSTRSLWFVSEEGWNRTLYAAIQEGQAEGKSSLARSLQDAGKGIYEASVNRQPKGELYSCATYEVPAKMKQSGPPLDFYGATWLFSDGGSMSFSGLTVLIRAGQGRILDETELKKEDTAIEDRLNRKWRWNLEGETDDPSTAEELIRTFGAKRLIRTDLQLAAPSEPATEAPLTTKVQEDRDSWDSCSVTLDEASDDTDSEWEGFSDLPDSQTSTAEGRGGVPEHSTEPSSTEQTVSDAGVASSATANQRSLPQRKRRRPRPRSRHRSRGRKSSAAREGEA